MSALTSLKDEPWASTADHCSWDHVICEEDWENKTDSLFLVRELEFNHTSWSGSFFDELSSLSKLEVLRTNGNSLEGGVPSQLCDISMNTDLYIVGDEDNCPNILTESGCCDEVKLTIPSAYLAGRVEIELGSADCLSEVLNARDKEVCGFMLQKNNHYVFQDDYLYPDREEFPYDIWLKVSFENILAV